MQPRFWIDPGSPAENAASTAGCTAIVAASSALPCRHALMNADAASSGDAAGLSGTVAGGAVVVVLVLVVLVLAVLVVVPADECDATVGDGSLSELQPLSSTNAHVPTATARYISPT